MKAVAILRDRVTIALAAAAILAIGIFALCWTVNIGEYDRWGFRIDCGTALASSYDQATLADQQPPPPPQPQGGYLHQCQSSVLWRRAWATAAVALGVGGAGLALLTQGARRPAHAERTSAE